MTSDDFIAPRPVPEEITWAADVVARLAALTIHLETYRDLDVECVRGTLRVRRVGNPGWGDTITCRRRSEDDGRLWFFTSWGEAIAQHDHVIDAAVRIHGYLDPAGDALSEVILASPVGKLR